MARASETPAAHYGTGSIASVTQSGLAPTVLLQQGTARWPADGNTLNIVSAGDNAFAAAVQLGSLNTATLILDGHAAAGFVAQMGTNLHTSLAQIGSNSDTGAITVAPGTRLSYVQFGWNLQPLGQSGIQSFSTAPGLISIVQTGY